MTAWIRHPDSRSSTPAAEVAGGFVRGQPHQAKKLDLSFRSQWLWASYGIRPIIFFHLPGRSWSRSKIATVSQTLFVDI
jgi:hypothetical protein